MAEIADHLSSQGTNLVTRALSSRPVSYLTSEWGLGICVALATTILYARTLEPSISGTYDSAEFQHAAYTLSLAHWTGYPLFLLLGKVWTLVFPFGDIAYRMNWFTAIWAVGTVALTYAIILQLTNHRIASALGALALATAEPFWDQAGMTEIGSFNTFLTAALFLCLLLWREGRVRLEICALVYGLALAHHRTVLFYAPGILLFILLTQPGVLRSRRLMLRLAGLVLLPFIVYIYVPLRASTAPQMIYDLSSFISYMIGTGVVASSFQDNGMRMILQRAREIPNLYRAWFSLPGLVFVFFGFWHWALPRLPKADDWAVKLLLGLSFVLVSMFTVFFGEMERYLLVPVMILAIAFGVGVARLARLWHSIQNLGKGFPPVALTNGLMSIALLALLVRAMMLGFPVADHSRDFQGYNFASEVLASPIEPGAIVIADWMELNEIRYVQQVEGVRPDILTFEGLRTPDIAALIQQVIPSGRPIYLTPGLKIPTDGYKYTSLGPLSRLIKAPNYNPGIASSTPSDGH